MASVLSFGDVLNRQSDLLMSGKNAVSTLKSYQAIMPQKSHDHIKNVIKRVNMIALQFFGLIKAQITEPLDQASDSVLAIAEIGFRKINRIINPEIEEARNLIPPYSTQTVRETALTLFSSIRHLSRLPPLPAREITWKEKALCLEQKFLQEHNQIKQDFLKLLKQVNRLVRDPSDKFRGGSSVFISSAQPDLDHHESWVPKFLETFAWQLLRAGATPSYEKIDSRFGRSIISYIEKMEESDFIILAGSDSLREMMRLTTGRSLVLKQLDVIRNKRQQAANAFNYGGLVHNDPVIPLLVSGNIDTSFPRDITDYMAVETINAPNSPSYLISLKFLLEHIFGVSQDEENTDRKEWESVWQNFFTKHPILRYGFSEEHVNEYFEQQKNRETREAIKVFYSFYSYYDVANGQENPNSDFPTRRQTAPNLLNRPHSISTPPKKERSKPEGDQKEAVSLKQKADKGNAESQFEYAMTLDPSSEEIFSYLKKAAIQEHPEAKEAVQAIREGNFSKDYTRGSWLLYKKGGQQNLDEAIMLLQKGVNENDPRSLYTLAHFYLTNDQTPLSQGLGREYLKRAADLEYSPAVELLKRLSNTTRKEQNDRICEELKKSYSEFYPHSILPQLALIKQPNENPAIELTQLFSELEQDPTTPSHLLLFGPTGSGKTSLCSSIANLWANGSWNNLFSAVFCIPLTKLIHTPPAQSIYAFLKELYFSEDSTVLESDLQHLFESNPEGVLLILDDYDTLMDFIENTPNDANLRLEQLLSHPKWIATSKMAISSDRLDHIDRIIEIGTFSAKEIEQHVRHTFDKDKATHFLQKLSQNGALLDVASRPFGLKLVSDSFEQLLENKTSASLYTKLVDNLKNRLVMRLASSKGRSLFNKRSEYLAALQTLEEVAWISIKQKNPVLFLESQEFGSVIDHYANFETLEQHDLYWKILQELAVLKIETDPNDPEKNAYTFSHDAFRYYFAALYIKRLMEEDPAQAEKCIAEHRFYPDYQEVWPILAHLLSDDANQLNSFFRLLDTPCDLVGFRAMLTKIRCLEECGSLDTLKNKEEILQEIQSWLIYMIEYNTEHDSKKRHSQDILIQTLVATPNLSQQFLVPCLKDYFPSASQKATLIRFLGFLGRNNEELRGFFSRLIFTSLVAIQEMGQTPEGLLDRMMQRLSPSYQSIAESLASTKEHEIHRIYVRALEALGKHLSCDQDFAEERIASLQSALNAYPGIRKTAFKIIEEMIVNHFDNSERVFQMLFEFSEGLPTQKLDMLSSLGYIAQTVPQSVEQIVSHIEKDLDNEDSLIRIKAGTTLGMIHGKYPMQVQDTLKNATIQLVNSPHPVEGRLRFLAGCSTLPQERRTEVFSLLSSLLRENSRGFCTQSLSDFALLLDIYPDENPDLSLGQLEELLSDALADNDQRRVEASLSLITVFGKTTSNSNIIEMLNRHIPNIPANAPDIKKAMTHTALALLAIQPDLYKDALEMLDKSLKNNQDASIKFWINVFPALLKSIDLSSHLMSYDHLLQSSKESEQKHLITLIGLAGKIDKKTCLAKVSLLKNKIKQSSPSIQLECLKALAYIAEEHAEYREDTLHTIVDFLKSQYKGHHQALKQFNLLIKICNGWSAEIILNRLVRLTSTPNACQQGLLAINGLLNAHPKLGKIGLSTLIEHAFNPHDATSYKAVNAIRDLLEISPDLVLFTGQQFCSKMTELKSTRYFSFFEKFPTGVLLPFFASSPEIWNQYIGLLIDKCIIGNTPIYLKNDELCILKGGRKFRLKVQDPEAVKTAFKREKGKRLQRRH